LLLLPPLQLVLAIAHDDGRPGAAGGGKSLGSAITVATLIDHSGDFGQRGKHARDRLLRRRLIPIALDAGDDLELRVLLDALFDSGMDGIVDRSAGEPSDLEEISALRLELRHLDHFLLAVILEVDHDAPGARLGDDAVEGNDDDAGIARLLD